MTTSNMSNTAAGGRAETGDPGTMLAIRQRVLGGPDVLEPTTMPRPEPAATEVLVRVGAAGICGSDIEVLEGRRPAPKGKIVLTVDTR